jgi:uncharacterized integral membrane protein
VTTVFLRTHLKADVLAFPVTVQPQHQIIAALRLLLQVLAHMGLRPPMAESKSKSKIYILNIQNPKIKILKI